MSSENQSWSSLKIACTVGISNLHRRIWRHLKEQQVSAEWKVVRWRLETCVSYSDVFPFFPQREIINVFYGPLFIFWRKFVRTTLQTSKDRGTYLAQLSFSIFSSGYRRYRTPYFVSPTVWFQFFADFDPTTRGERSHPSRGRQSSLQALERKRNNKQDTCILKFVRTSSKHYQYRSLLW